MFAALASRSREGTPAGAEDADEDGASSTTSDGEAEADEDVLEERVALAAIYDDDVEWTGARRMAASVAAGGAAAAGAHQRPGEALGVSLVVAIPRGYPGKAVEIVRVREEMIGEESPALSDTEREMLRSSIRASLEELAAEAAREQRVVLFEVIEGAREALQAFLTDRSLGAPGSASKGLRWASVDDSDFIGDDESRFDEDGNGDDTGFVARQARRSLEAARQATYERQRAQSAESEAAVRAPAPAEGKKDDGEGVERRPHAGAPEEEAPAGAPRLGRDGDKSFASRFGKSLSSLSSSFTSIFSAAPKGVVQALKLHDELDGLPEHEGEQLSKHQQKKLKRRKSAKHRPPDADSPPPAPAGEKGDRSESVRRSVMRDLLLARLLSLALAATEKPGAEGDAGVRRSAAVMRELEAMHVLPGWVLMLMLSSQNEGHLVKACDACLKSHATLKRFVSRFAKAVRSWQSRRHRERTKAGGGPGPGAGARAGDAPGADDDDEDEDDGERGREAGTEAPRPPSRLESDFIVQHRLGSGSFGSVRLARSRMDGRNYAIKRIPLSLIDAAEDVDPGNRAGMNEKLLREVSTLSSLQHAHVVRCALSPTHSRSHSLAQSLTRSLTDALTRSPTPGTIRRGSRRTRPWTSSWTATTTATRRRAGTSSARATRRPSPGAGAARAPPARGASSSRWSGAPGRWTTSS